MDVKQVADQKIDVSKSTQNNRDMKTEEENTIMKKLKEEPLSASGLNIKEPQSSNLITNDVEKKKGGVRFEEYTTNFGGSKIEMKETKNQAPTDKRKMVHMDTHFGKPSNQAQNNNTSTNTSNNVSKQSGNSQSNENSNVNYSSKHNDEEIAETLNTNRRITDNEIKKAPQILLEELSGEFLKNNKLKINAAGLTTGLRKARDGVAFFGKNKKEIINDFDLNLEGGEHGPHSFIIYYRKDVNKFFLKCYRDKIHTGQIHIKIDSNTEYVINKKEIVLLSETYFQLTPHSDGRLEIQNLGSSNKDDNSSKTIFDPSEYSSVSIGRDKKCTMPYPNDKSFSKVQTTLKFDSSKNLWKLKDGTADKPSTNGCWIYATHSFEITDLTIFQFGNSKFRITVVK